MYAGLRLQCYSGLEVGGLGFRGLRFRGLGCIGFQESENGVSGLVTHLLVPFQSLPSQCERKPPRGMKPNKYMGAIDFPGPCCRMKPSDQPNATWLVLNRRVPEYYGTLVKVDPKAVPLFRKLPTSMPR